MKTRFLAAATTLLLACAASQPPRTATPIDSHVDIATANVNEYALDAFPAWVVDHPDRECPATLGELDEYTSKPSRLDPWGTEYSMKCSKILVVGSAGADRRFGTADDIWSNR